MAVWPIVRVLEQFTFSWTWSRFFIDINLAAFVLLPTAPPPCGHLASLTFALAWPTFLVLYIRGKKQDSQWFTLKTTQDIQTLRLTGRQYTPNQHKFGIFSDCSQLCNYVITSFHTMTVGLFIKSCPSSTPDEAVWVMVRFHKTCQLLQKKESNIKCILKQFNSA